MVIIVTIIIMNISRTIRGHWRYGFLPSYGLVVLYFSFHTRQAMVPQLSCTMGKNETPPPFFRKMQWKMVIFLLYCKSSSNHLIGLMWGLNKLNHAHGTCSETHQVHGKLSTNVYYFYNYDLLAETKSMALKFLNKTLFSI